MSGTKRRNDPVLAEKWQDIRHAAIMWGVAITAVALFVLGMTYLAYLTITPAASGALVFAAISDAIAIPLAVWAGKRAKRYEG